MKTGIVLSASRVYSEIIPTPQGPLGVLAFPHFDHDSWKEVDRQLDSLQAAGVKELVIDLTENGGGLVGVAAQLAGRLAPLDKQGEPFIQARHRPRWERFDEWLTLEVNTDKTLALQRVYVLTTFFTCSASEVLITGLRPYLDVVQIGMQTCGKPYSMYPFRIGGETLALVTAELRNARNEPYPEGLSPDCHDFGALWRVLEGREAADRDVLLTHVRHHQKTGKCRPIS